MEPARIWISDADCRLEDFRRLVERHARLADYPLASAVHHNVLTYQGDDIRRAAPEPERRKALMAEWVRALNDGPGILLLEDAFADLAVVDAATDSFFAMIAEQRAANANAGDHFAKPGANDRIWNALEKLCLRDPQLFARYYANDGGRAGERGVARALLSGHLADQRASIPAARRSHRIATTTWGSRRRRCWRASPRTPIGCRRS